MLGAALPLRDPRTMAERRGSRRASAETKTAADPHITVSVSLPEDK